MIDLNFLPGKNILTIKERRWRYLLVVATILSSITFLVVNGGFFLFQWQLQNQTKALRDRKQALTSQLESYKDLAMTLRTLSKKAQGINLILGSQSDFGTEINNIRAVLGSVGVIRTIYAASSGVVTMEVYTNDYVSLTNILRNLASDDVAIFFHDVKLSELRPDVAGGFAFSVSLSYKPLKEGSLVTLGNSVVYREPSGGAAGASPGR